MRFTLEILFVHIFLWYHGYLYHDIFCSIHLFVQVIFFMSMHMYLDLTSEMALLTWSFMVVKSDVGVLTYTGKSIRFTPVVSIVLSVSVL